MKQAAVYRPGPPSVFELEKVDAPLPGPGQILIRVDRCGVSSRDVAERRGTYRRDVTYPLVMGLEIAGVITAVGAGVRGLAAGDRVCTKAFSSCGRCRLCRTGRESTCFERRPVRGGYAQYTALDADAAVVVPPGVTADQACTLGPAAGVALNAVRDTARVTLTDTVLVTGATGGVGSAAVQLARLSGARVIAHTRSARKRAALIEDGATDAVAGPTDRATADHIRQLTADGRGVDVVIDTVGARAFDMAFAALAVHGRYAFVGELFGDEISLNPARVFFKRAALLGVGSVSRAQLEDVLSLADAGKLKTRVAAVFPLDDIAKAHELVEGSRVAGRVLVAPNADAAELADNEEEREDGSSD